MMEDAELLRRYVQEGSEDAFSELVQRHFSLVYSSALRQVDGDAELAKDVSQTVFIDLARKARSLLERKLLVGWLYTGTRLAAATARRGLKRRQQRERLAMSMHESDNRTGTGPEEADLRPVLDSAMAELHAEDRDAVLLRFFQQRGYRSVGEELGISEDAARMRISRALERLHSQLVRRGVALSASALGAAISAQAVTAAPAGLAAGVAASALASAAASTGLLGLLNFAAMTNLKVAAVSALVIAGAATPVVWNQQARLRSVRQENESLKQQLEQVVQREQLAAQVRSGTATGAGSQESVVRADLEQLREDRLQLLRARDQLRALREQLASAGRPVRPEPAAATAPENPNLPGNEILADANADIGNYPPAIQQLLLTNYTRALDKLANARSEIERYLVLPEASKLAFVFGYTNEARAFATEALAIDQRYLKEPWRGGQAVHDANIALGRLALHEGDLEGAKQYLLAAGQTPGSPALGSFGPNMNLAKDLLRAGERQAVEDYFNLCSKFWPSGASKLTGWAETARAGGIPDFGANLLY